MNKIIQWMKGNIAIVASLALALLGVAFVAVVTFFFRGSVISSVEKQIANQTGRVDKLMTQTQVKIPGKDPGAPMEIKRNVVATPALIKAVQTIWDEYAKTGKEVRELARKINGQAHETTCIVPENGIVTTFNRPGILASYRNSFLAALWNPKLPAPTGSALAEADLKTVAISPLMAGQPLSAKHLQEVSDAVIREKLRAAGYDKFSDMPAAERTKAELEARNKVIEAMKERALAVGIYAETDSTSPAWPFAGMYRDWGKEGAQVPPELVYESQADLWILRDITEALRLANHVGENRYSVVNAPVKRLLRVQPQREGYVGLHTMGLVVGSPAAGVSSAAFQAPNLQFPPENLPQIENFFASPTGRISNAIYDVKHVKLEVLADVRQLPQLFEAISAVNMMTVVSVNLEDVDEYKELREGFYYYGPCDVVKATLVVETLWMRNWTVPKMPAEIRKSLGISGAQTH